MTTLRHSFLPSIGLRSALISVLTALTLVATTGAASAQDVPADGRRLLATIDPSDLSHSLLPAPASTAPVPSGEECKPTTRGSRERAAGATRVCVTTSPRPATRTTRAAGATTTTDAEPAKATCTITEPGVFKYTRHDYCMTGLTVLYKLYNQQGTELGTGTLEVSTSAAVPAAGTTWDENVTVRMTGATGQVTALNAKFRASCGTGCTATKTAPWYGGYLTVGQSLTGIVSYSSAPAAGAVAEFATSYKMYVTSQGATAVDPTASWDNPRKVRCDDAVRDTTGTGTPSPGCVIPTVTAVVPMSAQGSDPGGAVAAYQWAQQRFNDGWGKNKLLTREKSSTADRTARTCGSFDPNTDLVETDTCGEFPFAEAKEGGIDGAQCVEVIPNASSGNWDTYVLGDSRDLDPATPCVRAHVPAADKQFADAQLAEGFEDQRVIDADQFKVEFTTPAAAPQASCLAGPPAGSLPSGAGWVRNTTEPVAHTNKTTNPPGPAGTRPTMAQACLGKTLGKGSDATGDITGWQDAQLFAAANSPGTGQARCHLVANILGGKGRIRDGGQNNLVPCWQVGMNTGTPSMRTYEFEAQKEVAELSFGTNDAIFYQVTPVYRDATSTIPVGVTMSANIERANGTTELLFPNVYIPNTQGNTGLLNLGN
ncbi:DNA/RNA non-specific endonuclease [Streptomyces sp. NPDC058992]|uniref:DNA/RNA non-specific endonuclease n=1 Tax=Streptomyces sp. NPDC058992 TaxID=3346688 RepID=UPI00368D7ADD